MKALIIDDERMARREMRRLLEAHPEIEIVGEADSGHAALSLLPSLKPDVLFLDIQMPEMDGFEFVNSMGEHSPQIIFCTAYDAHALRAFEVNAVDYLLKPVDPERLAAAVQRLNDTPPSNTATQDETPLRETDRVLLKGEQRTWFVPVRSIYLLQSEGNYSHVFFEGGKVLLPRSLATLEQRLNLPIFFRANRAQLINTRAITNVAEWFNGGLQVTLASGDKVEISRRQAALFRKQKGL
jgi:two-component system, LytTR family, response regulator